MTPEQIEREARRIAAEADGTKLPTAQPQIIYVQAQPTQQSVVLAWISIIGIIVFIIGMALFLIGAFMSL